MKTINILILTAAISMSGKLCAQSTSMTFEPVKDNTIFNDGAGTNSNGSGDFIFAGKTDDGYLRRALVQFDFSDLPPSITIDNAELILTISKSISGDIEIALHLMESDWGEGDSDALGQEGKGDGAFTGDATWMHSFYDDTFWATPGGDFNETASASNIMGNTGSASFNSEQLTSDINNWLQNPSENFGWIILANENITPSAKRFYSRENSDQAKRTKLILHYVGPTAIESSELNSQELINITQNPISNEIYIISNLNDDLFRIRIYNITGAEIFNDDLYITKGKTAIQPGLNKPGIYLVSVSGNSVGHTARIVVQ